MINIAGITRATPIMSNLNGHFECNLRTIALVYIYNCTRFNQKEEDWKGDAVGCKLGQKQVSPSKLACSTRSQCKLLHHIPNNNQQFAICNHSLIKRQKNANLRLQNQISEVCKNRNNKHRLCFLSRFAVSLWGSLFVVVWSNWIWRYWMLHFAICIYLHV